MIMRTLAGVSMDEHIRAQAVECRAGGDVRRPMRILLAAWKCDHARGSEYLSGWGWATAYADAGHRVWVLCGPDGEPPNGTIARPGGGSCTFLRIGYPRWCAGRGVAARYAYWQGAALHQARRLHRQVGFDLVHHVSMASVQAGSALSRMRVPFVFGPVGGGQAAPASFARYFGDSWWRERLRTLLLCRLSAWNPWARATVRRSLVVLAANPDTARLARSLGARRVLLEPDAVIPKEFFPAERPPPKGVMKGLRLLWVGRSFPRKGLRLTLEGLARIPARVPWELELVGGGSLTARIPVWLAGLGIAARVSIRGQIPLSEVREAYLHADVFIFTSLRDSGPSQLLEAMSFALPVVTLGMHGQGFLVDEDRGIRVPAGNPAAAAAGLAAAITMLHDRRGLLRRLSDGAFAFAQREAMPCKFARIQAALAMSIAGAGAAHAAGP